MRAAIYNGQKNILLTELETPKAGDNSPQGRKRDRIWRWYHRDCSRYRPALFRLRKSADLRPFGFPAGKGKRFGLCSMQQQ